MKIPVKLASVLLAFSSQGLAQSFDAEAQWEAFFADARYERTNQSYAVLGTIYYSADGVDATACTDARTTLDGAVRDVPVSLALRHAAMLCAEARGDEGQADAHAEALSSLVRHATQEAGTGPWKLPIRVVRPEDVDTYLGLGDFERRYAYYGRLWPDSGLPLYVAAFQSSTGRERHIAFDWVDTLARLSSDDPLQGYFIDRHLIANAFLNAWAQDDDVAAVDLLGARQAMNEDAGAARRDRLKAAAGRGGHLAAQAWLELCTRDPFDGCGNGLVDALLPQAEQGFAMSRAQLGLAYLRGVGVEQDDEAGRALIEAADQAWEESGGLVLLATVLDLAETPYPAWLVSRLAQAEEQGAAPVRGYRTALRAAVSPETLSAADRTWLALPDNNRRGNGYELLALAAEATKSPQAAEWRERAAVAGSATSLRMRAIDVLATEPGDPRANDRLRQAALLGDGIAVQRMAYDAILAGKARESRDWLLGKVTEGDIDSLLMLAGLYEDGFEGLEQGPKDAIEIYEGLAPFVPAARRRLATLLVQGRGIEKDIARARRLLTEDPEDQEAAVLLGGLLLSGQIPGDTAEGRELLEKATAAGQEGASSAYGLWLVNNETTAEGRQRGLALLRSADAAGDITVLNNLAWVQCVSAHDDVRDANAGLAVARRIGAPESLPSGVIDTVAACEAAAGHKAEAIRLQSLALDRLPNGDAYDPTRHGMQARLALYRNGGRFIENGAEQN